LNISIIGIGDDGIAGISAVARSHVDRADIVVGGARHLAMLPAGGSWQQWEWSKPIDRTIDRIIHTLDRRICILASGDPLCYGIGSTLARDLDLAQVTILPAPSAFSLARGRLGWSQAETETLSLCGRDPDLLTSFLYPHAKILVLSADRSTPAIVANLLVERGYGASRIYVLEHLGGKDERILSGTAARWQEADLADLNTIAIECGQIDPQFPSIGRTCGLPDEVYLGDGQLTKREVRAITLSSLAPRPGELLWDVGAGSGSIAIEWLRSHPRCRAIAIERYPTRLDNIAANAATLGVPNLQIIPGTAPEALKDLPRPDAIFIGGGLTAPGAIDICMAALKPHGRLVANAVTVETELKLFECQQQWGGHLTRIAIQRAEPLGRFLAWKGMAMVTQWVYLSRT
jgi:precorrin-6B C5,15-methyltransferase / cobalt-precorrin-6B C5,C15-methyltransferase